jgi:dimethylsulfone monooxygenase
MGSANRLKLGLFGANCSSGRAVTTAEQRWSGNWQDNLLLARMAEDVGIEFMLPIGRWKGYGGHTDYQGTTLETLTWASGLLAKTERLVVFGTVHAPLIHPVVAAKQFVTADHIGGGRVGLNVVCGWNEGEFERRAARPRKALRIRQGMARRGQGNVGAVGGVRFRRQVYPAQESSCQAKAI